MFSKEQGGLGVHTVPERMGCSGSKPKSAVDDPVLVAGATNPNDVKPTIRDSEPEPEPPVAPTVCKVFVLDEDAEPCLDCPLGWLKATATEGKKAGSSYYYSLDGTSVWVRPEGTKEAAEPTCKSCGCLKAAHAACDTWAPQPGTYPPTCTCGFGEEDHKPCSEYRVNTSAAK